MQGLNHTACKLMWGWRGGESRRGERKRKG